MNKRQSKHKSNLLRLHIAILIMILLVHISPSYGQANFDAVFLQADSLLKIGRNSEALSLVNKVYVAESDDTTRLFYNIIVGKANLLSEPKESVNAISNAIALYEKLKYKYPQYIELLQLRGFASDIMDDRDDAEYWYRRALLKGNVVEHNMDIDNNCYLNLGNIYNERGDYNLALEAYNNINWIDSTQRVEIHADYYGKSLNKYMELSKEHRWQEALLFNDSLINYTKIKYGVKHSFYHSVLINKGVILNCGLHKLQESRDVYEDLIKIGKTNSIYDSEIADAYLRFTEISCNLGNLNDAINIFPEAVEYLNKNNDPESPAYDLCLYIGLELVKQEEYDAGIAALCKYLDNALVDRDSWAIPYVINKLSFAYLMDGANQKCIDLLSPIIEGYNSGDNSYQDSMVALYCQTIGIAYYFEKCYKISLKYLTQSEQIKQSIGESSDSTNIQYIDLCKKNS
jgi:tetratricopeptide (TPR) repeat protein